MDCVSRDSVFLLYADDISLHVPLGCSINIPVKNDCHGGSYCCGVAIQVAYLFDALLDNFASSSIYSEHKAVLRALQLIEITR